MKDILSEIIANKRFEVDLQKQAISIEQLQEGISEKMCIRDSSHTTCKCQRHQQAARIHPSTHRQTNHNREH